MKKKFIIVGSVVVALLATSTLLSAQSPSIITRDQAKEIALKQVSGVIEEVELEKERGSFIYEVEIDKNNLDDDFTIKIDAKTGKVLEVYEDDDDDKKKARTDANSVDGTNISHEAKQSPAKDLGSSDAKQVNSQVANAQANDKQQNSSKQESSNKQEPNNKSSNSKQAATTEKKSKARTMLTKEQAKKIALDEVGGKVVEVERDKDDGRVIYEIEVKVDRGEYEFEIDAYTGKILEKDFDREDDHDDERYDDDDDDHGDDDDDDDDHGDDDDDDDDDNDDRD